MAFLLAAVGCKQERPTAVAPPPVVAPAAPGAKGGTLGERLEREGSHRPAAAFRAEDVFGVLAKGGLEITERMQILGTTVGAAYCQNAHTASDVVVTVCEFEDEASAEKGKAAALSSMEIPNRQVVQHHATTLQVIESPKTEKSAKSAAAVLSAFSAM